MANPQLVQHFTEYFTNGESLGTITAARRQASQLLGEQIVNGSALTKLVDESVEAALVRVARTVIADAPTAIEAYDRLVDLYQRQPMLNVRSSTSILQQAYSTPLPIAFLASQLAQISSETTVYEPTAGHGALLIQADFSQVSVNEINPDRAAELKAQGYTVTEFDATDYQPEKLHDRIICNPPFGVMKHPNGRVKNFKLPGSRRSTTQIDQVIALRALETMKPDGRAVLILGGKLGEDDDRRSERYNSLESRSFFRLLYDQYNVTQHLSIQGALYRKQGAGFPIDLIVIEGRGKSSLRLPAARVPPLFKSFAELKELIPDDRIHDLSSSLSTGIDGHSSVTDRSSSGGDEPTDSRGILQSNFSTHRVDDSALDGANGRDTTANPSTPVISPEPSESLATAALPERSGLSAALGMGRGMGNDLRGIQRRTDAEVRPGISRDPPDTDPARSNGTTDQRSRFDSTSRLVERFDLRNDQQRVLVNLGEITMTENAPLLDVPYTPRSKAPIAETIIPTNMAAAAQKALDKLEQAVGDIDSFVQQRLGYDSKEQLWQHFYAEQIDAIALAFHQRDRGNIFLNGDQTGNGKGRFGAANLIDAFRQGYIPIFVTQQSNLYNAMLNDLADIGKPGFRVFATDNNLKLRLDDGRRLTTGTPAEQETEMQRIMQEGFGQTYNAIFTTYSQLQTIGNEEPFRREFFRAIAARAVFVFDESHVAGGVSKIGAWKTNAPPNRADFVRELVDCAAGAVFMSATSIKNSAVVDLYARRSDARYAVEQIDNLEKILREGGVPLQQMLATKFVAAGQMVRRGRSMSGISFESEIVPVDRAVAESVSAIMRSISDFDEAKQDALKELNKQLKAEAKALSLDNSIGQVGIKSTNFTSLMHNAIDQSLLAQKAEATVQSAIAAIERGEKPIIAVASTMDSFIGWYTKEHGIKAGDEINVTFGDILHRYLERSRDVLIKDYEGKPTRHRLTDEELGENGIAAYQDALDLIEATDLSDIPLSSIDYIKWRLTQFGYRVDEITGRKNIIDYSQSGKMAYGLRPDREVQAQGRIDIVNRFNRGDLDVVILNRSGATGISLHASERFLDQRPRHMIVAQVERDVNQVMQMLGRANRFGQVNKPRFTLLMSDLPAEKRLGAILAKKMAELNANVTAARESELSIANVVDFMNIYGEEVVTEILEEDYELQAKLGYPLKVSSDESEIAVIKRVTGRIPLLTIQEQEDLYRLIETETQELIAQKEAMGESVLRADQLDLDARTIAQMEVIPDTSGIESEFTGSVSLEIVDAKVMTKPMTQLQVINAVREQLNLEPVSAISEHDFGAVEAIARQQAQSTIATVQQEIDLYRRQALLSAKSEAGRDKLNARLDEQLLHLQRVFQATPPGTSVQVISPEGNLFYGVVSRIIQKSQNGSPAAPTNWRVQILIEHRSRQLTIPLTRFNRGKEDSATLVTRQSKNWQNESIYESFDLRQTQNQRTEVQIFTGNPIKAYEKFPKGKFVNYTTDQGEILQGLVMPASFDIQEALREAAVTFREVHHVKEFLTEATRYRGSVKTLDELLTIKPQVSARIGNTNATGFILQTVKASIGDQYSLDADIIRAAGAEFYSISDRMECIVPDDRIDAVLTVILKEKRWSLAAFDFKDEARTLLNIELPEFKNIEGVAAQDKLEQPIASEIKQVVPAKRILSATHQLGIAEKNIARFLEQAGLTESVMGDPEFYLQVPNEPYIPLTIDRHSRDLHFIHWLKDSEGDLFIDSEMIFQLAETGHLKLREVAVQNALTGGESRGYDKSFAQLFSRNILDQGFASVVHQLQIQQSEPEGILHDWRKVDRSNLTSAALGYLELKDQNPEALLLVRSRSGEFYEAYFSDANTIAEALGLLVVHKDLGNSAPHSPSLMIPARPGVLKRFTDYLQEQGFEIIVHEGQQTTQTSASNQTPFRELVEQVRHSDLTIVAAQLGLEQDQHDKRKWRNENHIISITEEKFKDWMADIGGGGAIDLVMHIQKVDFRTAVEWLSNQSLPQTLPQHQIPQKLELPIAQESNWSTVRQYLVETRGLPEDWIDRLHGKGLIYADAQHNAVFLRYPDSQDGRLWSRGHSTGASLRGTSKQPFHGLALGTSREQGWFWIRQGKGEIQRIVLVESAIDALSLAALEREKLQNPTPTVYLSTDGSGAIPIATLKTILANHGQVIAAFDADKAGEKMAWRAAESLPGVRRMTPATGKDWNDRWLAEQYPNREVVEVDRGDKQMLKSLWKWYRVAAELEKSEAYVQRIAQVAREFVEGVALSDKAIAAMQQDFQIYEQPQCSRRSLAESSSSKAMKVSSENGL